MVHQWTNLAFRRRFLCLTQLSLYFACKNKLSKIQIRHSSSTSKWRPIEGILCNLDSCSHNNRIISWSRIAQWSHFLEVAEWLAQKSNSNKTRTVDNCHLIVRLLFFYFPNLVSSPKGLSVHHMSGLSTEDPQ